MASLPQQSTSTSVRSSYNADENVPSSSKAPQGSFSLRIYNLELQNEKLQTELTEFKSWKISLEKWLQQEFSFLPDDQKADLDEDCSARDDVSTSSRDTLILTEPQRVVDVGTVDPNEIENNTITTDPPNSPSTSSTIRQSENKISTQLLLPPVNVNNIDKDLGKPVVDNPQLQTWINAVGQDVSSLNEKSVRKEKRKSTDTRSEKPRNKIRRREREIEESHADANRHRKASGSGSESRGNEEVDRRAGCSDGLSSGTRCGACGSRKPELGNKFINCVKCNICVHQACYGVSKIPEQFICHPCEAEIPASEQKCQFCPVAGGPLIPIGKQDDSGNIKCTNRWAHISCTFWIQGPYVHDPIKMDCVLGVSSIERSRWKLQCSFCKKGRGKKCCIQCIHPKCVRSFHVTCAFEKGLKMDLIELEPNGEVVASLLCNEHKNLNPKLILRQLHSPEQNDKEKKKIKERKKEFLSLHIY